jgi:hypothetical protein
MKVVIDTRNRFSNHNLFSASTGIEMSRFTGLSVCLFEDLCMFLSGAPADAEMMANCSAILNLTGCQADNMTSERMNIFEKVLVDVTTWFTACSIAAALFLNLLILLVYLRRCELRTPFNVYIVNLAVLEVIMSLTAMPGSFIKSFFGHWPYDGLSCSIFLYTSFVLGAIGRYGHVLITLNRLWAVTFPLSYKKGHTQLCARCLVVFSWILVHAVCLPALVRGRQRLGLAPADPDCLIDRDLQLTYLIIMELMAFSLPELFIIVAYFYISCKLRGRKSKKKCRIGIAEKPSLHGSFPSERRRNFN